MTILGYPVLLVLTLYTFIATLFTCNYIILRQLLGDVRKKPSVPAQTKDESKPYWQIQLEKMPRIVSVPIIVLVGFILYLVVNFLLLAEVVLIVGGKLTLGGIYPIIPLALAVGYLISKTDMPQTGHAALTIGLLFSAILIFL